MRECEIQLWVELYLPGSIGYFHKNVWEVGFCRSFRALFVRNCGLYARLMINGFFYNGLSFYGSVKYGVVVVIKLKVVSISFCCFVDLWEIRGLFHKSLGLLGGLFRSSMSFLKNCALRT